MTYKAGFIGLIGLPNAGKSSLANMLVGEKFSAVCSKAQTTRKRCLGIYSDKDRQAILVDAPGVISKKTGINSFLQVEYRDVMESSDSLLACLNLDAKDFESLDRICEMIASVHKPWAIVITKNDINQVHREALLRQRLAKYKVPIISVSIKYEVEKNREILLETLHSILPEAEAPLYPDDIYTLETMKDMASECVREKCFANLHQEIPYGLAVQVRKYEEGEKIDRIYIDIILDKESYKGILLGKNGNHLKRIGTAARLELEKRFAKKIHLDIHVRIKEKWTKNPMVLQELGYVGN